MSEDVPNTIEKALAINLDPLKYGTIVEIGAGQEVARWFFQAGAAAGSIAKTMSAYDMKFSDEIYGVDPHGRYVSRSRLERMLEQEFDLVVSRIEEHRPEGSTFFAFANTVAAQGFKKRAECHGWLGVRLQTAPKMPPDEIILHVRMLDDTNVEQQEALGILGVNLIYGAYFLSDSPEQLLRSLADGLKWGRIEIDLVEFRGPTLGAIDNRLMALELVKASLGRAVLFNTDGDVVIPADTLYKRAVLGIRGEFRPVLNADMAMLERGKARFFAEADVDPETTVLLAEMTTSELANDGEIDTTDFLSRVQVLAKLGFHVLISEYFRFFRVRQYLARYTREPVALVTDVNDFTEIMQADLYDGLSGGMLEGLGKLFPPATTVYVCPSIENDRLVTLDGMKVADPLPPLLKYLRDCGYIGPIDDLTAESLTRDSVAVLDDLQKGGDAWRDRVPAEAQEAIVEGTLFGYRAG